MTLYYKREVCLIHTGTLEVEILLCSKMRQITLCVKFLLFWSKKSACHFCRNNKRKKQFTKTKTWRSILNLIGHRFLWYICKTDITHQWRGTWNYILKPLSVNHSSHSFSYLHFENVMFTYGFKKDILDQYSMV